MKKSNVLYWIEYVVFDLLQFIKDSNQRSWRNDTVNANISNITHFVETKADKRSDDYNLFKVFFDAAIKAKTALYNLKSSVTESQFCDLINAMLTAVRNTASRAGFIADNPETPLPAAVESTPPPAGAPSTPASTIEARLAAIDEKLNKIINHLNIK